MDRRINRRLRRVAAVALPVTLLGGLGAAWLKARLWGSAPLPIRTSTPINAPSELARWPWPNAKVSVPHKGVTRWVAMQRDNTLVELLEFDWAKNPNLRFEIFDQDETDDKPFDNRVDYWNRSAAILSRELNQKFAREQGQRRRGRVVAAWNGAFFGYDRKSNNRLAFHVGPVILNGAPRYTSIPNHRWTAAWNNSDAGPRFSVQHLPLAPQLQGFEWGAGALQYLVRDGKPLHLQPFPQPGDKPLPQPFPSSPQDAGHVPDFDHMKSCRASFAWNAQNSKLWVVIVKEPDSEAVSILGVRHGGAWPGASVVGGWTVADLQRFWLALGAAHAVNSDAGDVGQRLLLLPDNSYDWIPPRLVSGLMRMRLKPDLSDAPVGGGPLMCFYVRDTEAAGANKAPD